MRSKPSERTRNGTPRCLAPATSAAAPGIELDRAQEGVELRLRQPEAVEQLQLYCQASSSPRSRAAPRARRAARRHGACASVEPTSCTREGAVEVAEHGEASGASDAQQHARVRSERGAHDALGVGLEGRRSERGARRSGPARGQRVARASAAARAARRPQLSRNASAAPSLRPTSPAGAGASSRPSARAVPRSRPSSTSRASAIVSRSSCAPRGRDAPRSSEKSTMPPVAAIARRERGAARRRTAPCRCGAPSGSRGR